MRERTQFIIFDLIQGTLVALAGRVLKRFNRPLSPRAVNYALTYRCNHRCQMCVVHRADEFVNMYGDELSSQEVKKIFQDDALKRIDVLRITGGEPFLRDDITDVVLDIAEVSNPGAFYISTNGSFPEKVSEFLKEVLKEKVNIHLQVSIDGIGSMHDEIRGVPGSFDKAYQTLESVKRIKEKYPFYAGINHTLVRRNLRNQEEVERLAKKFGFGYKPMLARLYCESTFIDINPLEKEIPHRPFFELSREELKDIYKRFEKLTGANGRWTYSREVTTSFFWKVAEKYLYEGEMNRLFKAKSYPKPPCMALFAYFRLLPNGDVVACRAMLKGIGNLRESTFSVIWNSPEANEIRKDVKRCRGCWTCDIGPSIYYSGDIILWMIKYQLRRIFGSWMRQSWYD